MVATVGAGMGVATADASAASAKVHTQRFDSRTVQDYQLAGGNYVDFSRDVAHGKLIGSDSSSGRYHESTGVVTGYVTFFRNGGTLRARFRFDTRHSTTIYGTITGGQGTYRGVTGTVTGQVVSDTVTRTTLTYRR